MKILYVDVYIGGHHLAYAKGIITQMAGRGCEVDVLTTKAALESLSYREHVAQLPASVNTFYLVRSFSFCLVLPEVIRMWLAVRSAFNQLEKVRDRKYDAIFLSNCSGIYQAIGLLGSPFGNEKLMGMLVSVRYHLSRLGMCKSAGLKDLILEQLFFRFLSNKAVSRVITIDPLLLNDSKTMVHECFWKLKCLEHPFTVTQATDRSLARANLGVKDSSTVVLIFGALSHRKAIDTVLAAAVDRRIGDRVSVVVAGIADSSATATLGSSPARYLRERGLLIEKLRFVSESEESELFAAADIVWVAYREFYDTSGVLLSAYAHSKAVIGCNKGHIALSVTRHNTGLVVNPDSVADVVAALLGLLASDEIRETYGARGKSVTKWRDPEGFFANIVAEVIEAGSEALV